MGKEPWSLNEVKLMRRKAKTNTSREVAQMLKRTTGSVTQKAFAEGISFRKPKEQEKELNKHFQPASGDKLSGRIAYIRAHADKLHVIDIANNLGIEVGLVMKLAASVGLVLKAPRPEPLKMVPIDGGGSGGSNSPSITPAQPKQYKFITKTRGVQQPNVAPVRLAVKKTSALLTIPARVFTEAQMETFTHVRLAFGEAEGSIYIVPGHPDDDPQYQRHVDRKWSQEGRNIYATRYLTAKVETLGLPVGTYEASPAVTVNHHELLLTFAMDEILDQLTKPTEGK